MLSGVLVLMLFDACKIANVSDKICVSIKIRYVTPGSHKVSPSLPLGKCKGAASMRVLETIGSGVGS